MFIGNSARLAVFGVLAPLWILQNLPGGQVGLWTVNKRLDFMLKKMAVLSKLGYSRVFFECWTEQYIYI